MAGALNDDCRGSMWGTRAAEAEVGQTAATMPLTNRRRRGRMGVGRSHRARHRGVRTPKSPVR